MHRIKPSVMLKQCFKLPSFVAAWSLAAILLGGVGTLLAEETNTSGCRASESLAEKWGIQVASLHLSAQGYMVDFRYKVLDPKKAAMLADPHAKPYLVDQTTGAKLLVPRSPKVGPMRQSAQSVTAGKVYFTLFSNLHKTVKTGSKVSVVIGDFKAEDLVVE